jgi:hypothetical protein
MDPFLDGYKMRQVESKWKKTWGGIQERSRVSPQKLIVKSRKVLEQSGFSFESSTFWEAAKHALCCICRVLDSSRHQDDQAGQ